MEKRGVECAGVNHPAAFWGKQIAIPRARTRFIGFVGSLGRFRIGVKAAAIPWADSGIKGEALKEALLVVATRESFSAKALPAGGDAGRDKIEQQRAASSGP